jgi:sulfoquinovosidase
MLDLPSTEPTLVATGAHAFEIRLGETAILRHAAEAPAFFMGSGRLAVEMYRGNFTIADDLDERVALRHATLEEGPAGPGVTCAATPATRRRSVLRARREAATGALVLTLEAAVAGIDRFWMRLLAGEGERVWGCGEQMSYFNLRGRRFPLWTSEPGVGRDKTTEVTWRADVTGRAGGDYHHTGYPQPTFLSERRYYVHAETSRYAVFDFRNPAFHELAFTEVPGRVVLEGPPTSSGSSRRSRPGSAASRRCRSGRPRG